MIPELKILVASPGDVIQERERASQIIRKLQQELAGQVKLRAVLWEHDPVNAGETFQEQIPHPADAHIVITILWKRLGTFLPEAFADSRGRPRTGTEYEYEEAIRSFERNGSPEVWVYRSKQPIALSPIPEEQKEERNQLEMLDRFWKKWIEAKKKGHKWFPDGQAFQEMLETDIRATVDQVREKLEQFTPYREKLDRLAREWKDRRQPPDLLLPPGQMLKDAEQIRRSFATELDPITDAFIRESLLAKSHQGRRRALVLLFLVLGLAVLFLYLMVDARIAKQMAVDSKELTEEIKTGMKDLLDGMGLAEHPAANPTAQQMKRIEQDLQPCRQGYQAFAKLKNHIEQESLDLWGSKFLDNYGRMLVRVGAYREAEAPFWEALAIDQRRVAIRPEDDERQRFLLISHVRMAGLGFCQMKSKGSPEYQKARQNLERAEAVFHELAAKASGEESRKIRAGRHAQVTNLLKEFNVTEFLALPPNQAELVKEGTLTEQDLEFFSREETRKDYVPRCQVFAVELHGGKNYQFRLEAEKKEDKPSFDTYLLLQNGIYETVHYNDDFDKSSTDAQMTVPIWHSGTYRLFVASAPRPAPKLPATGKYYLKIKITDGTK
jgi:hypothetical protein